MSFKLTTASLLLGTLSLSLLPSMASAADLDEATSQQAWTGFYAGGYVGAGAAVTNFELPPIGPGNFNGLGGEGILGGVMVGYNYQVSPEFVIGIQGDISATNLDIELNVPGIPLSVKAGPNYIASISGRLGWLPTQDTMLYVLGGYSHSEFEISLTSPGPAGSLKQDYSGFHVGAGVETKLSSNVTARLEYRYTGFSGEDWGTGGILNVEPSIHTATFGLAWNWYNPDETVSASAREAIDSDWNGFYIGGQVGAGAAVTNLELPVAGPGNFNGLGGEGILGGVFVGYNHQVSPDFVVGIQGDISATNLDIELNIPAGPLTVAAGPNYIASISGRLGWLPTDNTMLYLIGGYSHSEVEASLALGPLSGSISQDYSGFHAGAGVETKLTSNLSARLEYRYTAFTGEDWGTGGFLNVEPSVHTATFGLAYNF